MDNEQFEFPPGWTPSYSLPAIEIALSGAMVGLACAARYKEHKAESAAVAITVTLIMLEDLQFPEGFRAPLMAALEILEADINPDKRSDYDRVIYYIKNRRAPPQPTILSQTNMGLSLSISDEEVLHKIVGSLAISFQMNCGANLQDALKALVGHNREAAKKLKNFRYNMLEKDTPKGARDYYFDAVQTSSQFPPQLAAYFAIKKYRKGLEQKS